MSQKRHFGKKYRAYMQNNKFLWGKIDLAYWACNKVNSSTLKAISILSNDQTLSHLMTGRNSDTILITIDGPKPDHIIQPYTLCDY